MLSSIFALAYVGFTALLFAHASITLTWMLYAWRTPDAQRTGGFAGGGSGRRHTFSLLVPARHEEAVLGHTLDRLAAMDHPRFEVLAIVGEDDDGTRRVAEEAALRHPDRVRVVVDDSWPKNKPKALNRALIKVRGDIVGVFDAEDEVHPGLISAVDRQFSATSADVVQAGVQLVNFWSDWYSVRNVLEYYFWFKSRLHLHAAERFIPLGGNTVFVKTAWLDEVGGWDAECLTEDCDLGVRLSLAGARFTVAYDPRLLTREETPPTFAGWLRQRTRWNQGFLQVLRKGDWRRLPDRRRRMFAWYTLAMPFVQAAVGLLIPLAIVTMILGSFPIWLAVLTLLPALPTAATLAVEVVALGDLADTLGERLRLRDRLRLVLGALPYQVALAVAAVRALWRERTGDLSWEKTDHVGSHQDRSPDVEVASVA